jgi:hypothetical protein
MNDFSQNLSDICYRHYEEPFGLAWKEWVVKWWQWSLELELEGNSPVEDENGTFCCKNQKDPNVWFLAGTYGGHVKRKCTISRDKSIFFPVITDLITFFGYKHLNTVLELENYAKSDLDTLSKLEVYLDGFSLYELYENRVRSNYFEITYPFRNNSGDLNSSNTGGISDGYWLFLKPLTTGTHHLHFTGEKAAFDEMSDNQLQDHVPKFRVSADYILEVE